VKGGELGEGLSALLDQILNGVELIGDKDEPKFASEAQLIDLLEEASYPNHGLFLLSLEIITHFLANADDKHSNRVIHSIQVVARKSFLNCLVRWEKRGMSGTKKTRHRKSKQT
jgi:hypothetical protein